MFDISTFLVIGVYLHLQQFYSTFEDFIRKNAFLSFIMVHEQLAFLDCVFMIENTNKI
jgi:hypothetical protein